MLRDGRWREERQGKFLKLHFFLHRGFTKAQSWLLSHTVRIPNRQHPTQAITLHWPLSQRLQSLSLGASQSSLFSCIQNPIPIPTARLITSKPHHIGHQCISLTPLITHSTPQRNTTASLNKMGVKPLETPGKSQVSPSNSTQSSLLPLPIPFRSIV